jgi:hypothetical protein
LYGLQSSWQESSSGVFQQHTGIRRLWQFG